MVVEGSNIWLSGWKVCVFDDLRKVLRRMPEALCHDRDRCPVGAVNVSLPAIQ
jgi:hypothetical protein